MDETITITQAINDSINLAKNKINGGKLISTSNNSFDWDDEKNWGGGDPETIESIASLNAQFVNLEFDEARDLIIKTLSEKFPNYV